MTEIREIHPVSRLPEMTFYECDVHGWVCEDTAVLATECAYAGGDTLTTAPEVQAPYNCAGSWYLFMDEATGTEIKAKLSAV